MILISVCIPSFNRAEVLPDLLESILSQNYNDFEIIICEDMSPQRRKIADIISKYNKIKPGLIRYFENTKNLGYDANIRNLIEKSNGQYCFFMGNDDLMCDGALRLVAKAIKRYRNVGVLLRSYAAFENSSTNIVQTFRYFNRELFFPAGEKTISTIYRRSVVISGMVINRSAAMKWATKEFDGTLLYQLYLVANILIDMNAVYLPEIIVLYRNGGVPDFGSSDSEKSKFLPKEQTVESSIYFVKGMLEIAKFVQHDRDVKIYKNILRDISNYSYPILAIQAKRPLKIFVLYCISLARLGMGSYFVFYIWLFLILIFGSNRIDRLIIKIKKVLGHTPTLGRIYRGVIK